MSMLGKSPTKVEVMSEHDHSCLVGRKASNQTNIFQGNSGVPGLDGLDGLRGMRGQAGFKGIMGDFTDGPDGRKGQKGFDGFDGSPGLKGMRGKENVPIKILNFQTRKILLILLNLRFSRLT